MGAVDFRQTSMRRLMAFVVIPPFAENGEDGAPATLQPTASTGSLG